MKRVLQERGLWRGGPLAQCKIENPNKAAKFEWIKNPECLPSGTGSYGTHSDSKGHGSLSRCARGIFSSQADFRTTRKQNEEIIEGAGNLVIFYPKFNPRLN
jgi:hypothetical protein